MVGPAAGELVVAGEDLLAIELIEDGIECTTVPVIRDTPPVVALPRQVLDGSKGHLLKGKKRRGERKKGREEEGEEERRRSERRGGRGGKKEEREREKRRGGRDAISTPGIRKSNCTKYRHSLDH